jgi:hypothetical protein
MASYEFTLATNLVVDPPTPLEENVPTVIWTSANITLGGTYTGARVFVTFHEIVPDTEEVSPFDFEFIAVLDQLQVSGTWVEIGRQNTPIRKISQGKAREILVMPSANNEEGVDFVTAGFWGIPQKLKSIFKGDAQGTLRVRLLARDGNPSGPYPFDRLTISCSGNRFDG